MKVLFRQSKIVDPNSKHHSSTKDILVEKGEIVKIAKSIKAPKSTKIVEAKNLKISPGWVDCSVHFGEPGFEFKEDLESGCRAAKAGGFTAVALLPNTNPTIENKSQIEFIKSKTANSIVDVLPVGALTHKCEGTEPTEIYDMYNNGAIAFSNGTNAIADGIVISRSLQYVQPFNGLVMLFPDDGSFGNTHLVNESAVSTKIGMKGQPDVAEEIAVNRILKLLEYTNSRVHLLQLSSKKSIALLKQAKKSKLNITAAVAPYHLIFSDSEIETFDSNFKMNPPLRSTKDANALVKALNDDTIDVITSFHTPQDEESKKLEFEYAKPGMIGLQTCYALLKTELSNAISDETFVKKVALNPRKILGLDNATIAEGNKACFTFFNNEKWTFTEKNNQSKSTNTPFFKKEFVGKVIGIYNKGQLYLNKF